jgi:3-mercaptopyruvate sulfurtransferase SseA
MHWVDLQSAPWGGRGRALMLVAILGVLAAARPALPSEPWKPSQVMPAYALAQQLAGPKNQRPVILQVGFRFLYEQAHIPGAEFCGPASKSDGREALRRCAERIPKDKEVVIYCGCCPWKDCPNIRPAFRLLTEMGFRRLRVLDIPRNFDKDWVAKGYPTGRKI